MYRESSQFVIAAFDGKVFALDRMTGEVRWRVDMTPSGGPVELSIDDDVIVACDSHMLAFVDYRDGTVRKKVRRKDAAVVARPIFVIDGAHILIAGLGEVACYSREGEFLWDQTFPDDGYAPAAIGVPGRVRQADKAG